MADVSPSGHSGDNTRTRTSRRAVAAGTPRWVKVFAWVTLALVLLFAGLHVTGHGMGSHMNHEMRPRGGAE